MSYRDDLEAAHARIEALEAQLASVGGAAGEPAALRELEQRASVVESQLQQLRAQTAEMKAVHERLAALIRSSRGTAMLTLPDHNRGSEPRTEGTPAGVACPMCHLLFNEMVEMHVGSSLGITISSRGKANVKCPRCEYNGMKIG